MWKTYCLLVLPYSKPPETPLLSPILTFSNASCQVREVSISPRWRSFQLAAKEKLHWQNPRCWWWGIEHNSGSNIKHWQKAPSVLCKWRKHYFMNGKLTLFFTGVCWFLVYLVFIEIQQKFQICNEGLVLYAVNFIRGQSNHGVNTIFQSWWKCQIVTTISIMFTTSNCCQKTREKHSTCPINLLSTLSSGFRSKPLVCKIQLLKRFT